jgi:hypothetical protein
LRETSIIIKSNYHTIIYRNRQTHRRMYNYLVKNFEIYWQNESQKKSRNQEIKKSRNQEIKKSRNQEIKKSRNQEIKKSRNQEIKKSRNQEIKKSRNQYTNTPIHQH